MKKLSVLFMAFCMVVMLMIPSVYAVDYNGHEFPQLPSVNGYDYSVIFKYDDSTIYALISKTPLHVINGMNVGASGSQGEKAYVRYKYNEQSNAWTDRKDYDDGGGLMTIIEMLWSNHDVYDVGKNEMYHPSNVINYCDGSSCPATDVNKDNVCDDCGLMLTMSLRSTLYDYALTYMGDYQNNNPDYQYWLIANNGDGYSVLLTKTPAVYDSSTDTLIVGDDAKTTNVVTNANGQNVGDGWAIGSNITSASSVRDSVVSTNYTIDGFFPIPLWEEMGQVTQGEMTNLSATMGGTMKVLVPCGVGLMALLVVLSLFGKRSLIFRS